MYSNAYSQIVRVIDEGFSTWHQSSQVNPGALQFGKTPELHARHFRICIPRMRMRYRLCPSIVSGNQATGLSYLHRNPFAHSRLKTSMTILLLSDATHAVISFALCRKASELTGIRRLRVPKA